LLEEIRLGNLGGNERTIPQFKSGKKKQNNNNF